LAADPISAEFHLKGTYDRPTEFIGFGTVEAAHAALEAGEIQAYFILPENYLPARRVEVVFTREPGENVWRQFYDFLQVSLLAGHSPEVVFRAAAGVDVIVRSIDGRREVPAFSGPTFGLLMPLFVAMAFLFMLLISSGYTMSAMVDEKENRTMEVLVTSVSPVQLMGGKILGIVATSLTLLLSWTLVIVLGIFIGRQAGVGWLANLGMDWRAVVATVGIAVPAYVVATALMTALGATVNSTQEGQSASTIFFILHLAPLYAGILFLKDSHSSLAVLLSVLPFTSLMTVGMRNLFTVVPAWQVAVSVGVQVICAVGAIWLASRAFRLGLLYYGQRISFRRLLGRGVKG
jgi:ABC-2 type transport system permease protein